MVAVGSKVFLIHLKKKKKKKNRKLLIHFMLGVKKKNIISYIMTSGTFLF